MRGASQPPGVLDANTIIGLAKGGCLHLINRLFAAVYVPPLVVAELKEPWVRQALDEVLDAGVVLETPSEGSAARAGSLVRTEADAEALALALDYPPALLLTGDETLQKKARRLGVESLDAVALVRLMVAAGLLPRARPVLDRMREHGFGIHEPVYQRTLRVLGE